MSMNEPTDQIDLRAWAAAQHARPARPKAVRILVECLECGKKFAVGPMASPECPRCHGTDIDVRD
jgi:Zn finger protein HypA/HybF involved in hydrogenase expression